MNPVPEISIELPDQLMTETLAADIAACAAIGDVIALSGGLGAGKTTFARAFVRAFCDQPDLEVPSPTFTLVQTYDAGRFPVAHLDLYRIKDPDELEELGFDELSGDGAVLIEWPDRAEDRLPADRLDIIFDMDDAGHRARLVPAGNWVARLARTLAIRRFLEVSGWPGADRRHIQGDVSTRRYERITTANRGAVIMDWPPGPAPAPESYIRRVGRAFEVGAFWDIARALRAAGLSAPEIYHGDRDSGLLLLEDFGRQTIAVDGLPDPQRYAAAVAVLAEIHRLPRDPELPAGAGAVRTLRNYDSAILTTEVGLFIEHFVPFASGRAVGPEAVGRFRDIWAALCQRVTGGPSTWVLLDFHSPNLMWLPGREGIRRVGLLDIQDALFGPAAYDVAALLQDARVTVPPELEAELMAIYLDLRRAADEDFDAEEFRAAYHILGAQRAMKVLGIFARLGTQGHAKRYLAHMPRLRAYLHYDLSHPVLSDLALWYEEHLPRDDQAVQ